MRSACAVLALLSTVQFLRADDGLPADVLQSLKSATVFVKVQAGKLSTSGSGFVLKTDGDAVYIVTNHHVVRPSIVVTSGTGPLTKKVKLTARDAAIAVVFDSGTRKERTARAAVIADDEQRDLAILKVTGLKDLPAPIAAERPPDLRETMPVYVVGFPFGKALSTSKGNPAITIGKGSVSSLRLNDAGELAFIQIDGALNPGNSGGPVVDTRGRLIGIAVARIKDSAIGLTIPAQDLTRMLKGRVGGYTVSVLERGKDALKVKVELRLIDPLCRLRGVTFHYAPSGAPVKGPVAALPEAKRVLLDIKEQVGVATILLPLGKAPVVPITFQTEYVDGDGKVYLTAVRAGTLKASADAPPGQPLTRDALTAALADLKADNAALRRSACDRLARAAADAEGKEVAAALAPLLTDADLFTRCAALKAHMNWAGKDGVSLYYDLLKSDSHFVARAVLIEGLAKLDGAKAAVAIAARLPESTDRSAAGRALRGMGAAAESAVAAHLGHRDWGVRLEACLILKDVGTANSVPALKVAGAGLDRPLAENVERAANEAIAAIAAR